MKKNIFWLLPNFHGFQNFGLKGSVCEAIMGIFTSTWSYKGWKSFKQEVKSTIYLNKNEMQIKMH